MPNLPSEFIERTRQLMGEAECNALCRALQADEPVSIRTNTGKNAPAPPQAHPVPWTDNGFYLNRRPAFTFDPLFHAVSVSTGRTSAPNVEAIHATLSSFSSRLKVQVL